MKYTKKQSNKYDNCDMQNELLLRVCVILPCSVLMGVCFDPGKNSKNRELKSTWI